MDLRRKKNDAAKAASKGELKMGQLFLHVTLRHKSALLAGETRAGDLAIPVTDAMLAALTSAEREALDQSVSESGDPAKAEINGWANRLSVEGLSIDAIQSALRTRLQSRLVAAANAAAKHVASEALLTGPVEGRIEYDAARPIGERHLLTAAAHDLTSDQRAAVDTERSTLRRAECEAEDVRLCAGPITDLIALHKDRWVIPNEYDLRQKFPRALRLAEAEAAARNAQAQAVADLDAAEQAQQFSSFVGSLLSDEQRERFVAGCLPVQERDAVLREHLFAAFAKFASYAKLTSEDLDHDEDCERNRVSFDVDTVKFGDGEMTAGQFATWRAIEAACVETHDNATVELRCHEVSCRGCSAVNVDQYGAKVTIKLAAHSYSREFAL